MLRLPMETDSPLKVYQNQPGRSDLALLHLLYFVLFLVIPGTSYAYIPTAEQDCQFRNSAICELNGIQYYIDSDCPSAAKVIKPLGHERCDQSVPANKTTVPVDSGKTTPGGLQQDHVNPASIGNMERWLLPTLVITFALIVLGIVIWAIRWAWRHRFDGNMVLIRSAAVFRYIFSVICAVYATYYTFVTVYMRIFSSFDNHDSAGPGLIAAVPAFLAAPLVTIPAFFITNWILKAILDKFLKPSEIKKQ